VLNNQLSLAFSGNYTIHKFWIKKSIPQQGASKSSGVPIWWYFNRFLYFNHAEIYTHTLSIDASTGNADPENPGLTRSETRVFGTHKMSSEFVLKCMNRAYSMPRTMW